MKIILLLMAAWTAFWYVVSLVDRSKNQDSQMAAVVIGLLPWLLPFLLFLWLKERFVS